MPDDRTRAVLSAPPLALLLRLAAPNTAAFFVQAGVSLTEIWFIGRLGTTSLAAIALAFPLLMLTQTLSGGALGGAVASALARAIGAGDTHRAERLIWHALVLASAGAALLLALFLLLGAELLVLLGGAGESLDHAYDYCLVLLSGGLLIWLMGTLSAVFRGMGDMRFPALLMILGAFVQVPLSGALVLGAFGMPQLGVAGAALSALTSALIVSAALLARLCLGRTPIRLRLTTRALDPALFRDILRVALPASLSPLLTVTTILSLTAIVGRFGPAALAGYGIGARIEFLLIPLVFGLGAAMTSAVGMNIGAGNLARAERLGWTGGSAAALVAGSIGLVLALLPSLWIPAFTSDPETYAAAEGYIRIVGPCFAFHGLGLSLYFASQGAGAMLWPVAATVLRILIAVVGALALAFGVGMGLTGVYAAAALAMVAYGASIAVALGAGAWRDTSASPGLGRAKTSPAVTGRLTAVGGAARR